MKERPILFSAPMVRAILAGTKTQTRREAKKPVRHQDWGNLYTAGALVMEHEPRHVIERACPYGQPGDRLWVRETWNQFDGWAGYLYAADYDGWGIGPDDDPDHVPDHAVRWRPSIHMPRAASRILLEITGVRVERLQDISEADAIAEGVDMEQHITLPFSPSIPWATATMKPRSSVDAYAALWASINGTESWNANPWVWVVEFKRVETEVKP